MDCYLGRGSVRCVVPSCARTQDSPILLYCTPVLYHSNPRVWALVAVRVICEVLLPKF